MLMRRDSLFSGFLAALSGLALAAAFPKAGWDALAWVGLVPLLWAIRDKSPMGAARLGLVFGIFHFSALLYWVVIAMTRYGGLPAGLSILFLLLLSAVLAAYTALFCALVRLSAPSPGFFFVAVPAAWVGVEFLRMYLFTGFPWCSLGHALYRRIFVIQIADLGGVPLLSGLAAAVNAAIFLALAAALKAGVNGRAVSRRSAALALGAAGVLVAATLCYGRFTVDAVDKEAAAAQHVAVAAIQGNIDQAVKWDPAYQAATMQKYLSLTRYAAWRGAKLAVWPESAMPFHFLEETLYTGEVFDLAHRTGLYLLAGSPFCEPDLGRWRCTNRAYFLSPGARVLGSYDKAHLVPWGEYVPLKSWMPFIGKLTQEVGDFSPGEPGVVLSGGGMRIGVGICYEIIFPVLCRKQFRAGANLLATITNDAWYDRSSAPYQHFAMAVFRAVENKRSLVRAANTGISGFVDPVGRVISPTGLFVDAAPVAPLPLMGRLTLYTRQGDFFAISCLILTLLLVLLGFKKRLDS